MSTPDAPVAAGAADPHGSEGSRLELGYFLSSEEHTPAALVRNAAAAHDAGFASAMISDHLQPWTLSQGQSPFVWTVIGAIAQAAPGLEVGTGVSAVVHRVHPVVLAHAAATATMMLDGRFFLGLGTGERINEQVMGQRWPRAGDRRRMLEEAVPLLRRLLAGERVNHRGRHFQLEHAQIHSRPPVPPPIMIAAGGRRTARVAGACGDGLIGVTPQPEIVSAFEKAGGRGKPRYAQLKVCWAASDDDAVDVVRTWFPTAALPPSLLPELSQPAQFAEAAELLSDDAHRDAVVCGPEPERYIRAIGRLVGAGFTRVYLHQVGPDQRGFLDFFTKELEPELRPAPPARRPRRRGVA